MSIEPKLRNPGPGIYTRETLANMSQDIQEKIFITVTTNKVECFPFDRRTDKSFVT